MAHVLSSPAALQADVGENGMCISQKDAARLMARLKNSALLLVAATLMCMIMGTVMGVLVLKKISQNKPPANENTPLHPS